MLILLENSSYNLDNFVVNVEGMNVDVLNAVLPICSAMDMKVKDKILEAANDPELTLILQKTHNKQELTTPELLRLSDFNKLAGTDFSIQECIALFDGFRTCIKSVLLNENDVTADFVEAIKTSPKYLKMMGNLVYTEYKAATEVSDIRKN